MIGGGGGSSRGPRLGNSLHPASASAARSSMSPSALRPILPSAGLQGEENPFTVEYLRMLERTIRRNPPYWLWSHNRWKRSR